MEKYQHSFKILRSNFEPFDILIIADRVNKNPIFSFDETPQTYLFCH